MIGGNFQSPNPHRSQFAGGLRMDEATKVESHQSVKAFVEGGVQDACDDACSICLEVFCESDPSTVTTCKHEFHLQCILEWCQRSSQCPMCWQPISLKDSTSQELLEAVEEERSFRVDRSRNTTIFHHSAFENFELRHLPIDPNDAELEERIIQHLAAAAAMRRACHITRREGQQGSSRGQGHPQFLVLSTHPNTSSTSSGSASSAHRGGQTEAVPAIISANPSLPLATAEEEPSGQAVHISPGRGDQIAALPSENNVTASNRPALYSRSSSGQSAPVGQDRAGPSDFQSFSETFKSRLNSVSMRYRDSFSRSTQGWKEKLFSRSTSMADIGSGVRREVSAGISTVSRMFERLETREPTQANSASNEGVTERHSRNLANDSNTSTSRAGNSC